MPTRNIVAAQTNTELQNIAVPAIQNPKAAGIGYETDTQLLYIYDPVANAYYGVPVTTLNGLTVPAATINQALAPNNAPVNQAPTLCPLAYARYNFAVDGGGAPGLITPAVNTTIPANAIITGCVINSTTALVGPTQLSIGLSAGGGGAAALLALTNTASFSLDAKIAGVPVPQTAATWIKMSAAGQITVTTTVAPASAGVIEIFVDYVLALNS